MAVLSVGVGESDITPEPGLEMWGFIAREGPGAGTLDPLYARALVVQGSGSAAALVGLDLGRVPRAPHLDAVRVAAQALGVDDVVFLATHTHHAPSVENPGTPYSKRLEADIISAICQAHSRMRPAVLRVAAAEASEISHNRRSIGPDGRCTMVWRTARSADRGLTDPEATWVVLDGEDGRPIASVVHFACHPVFMGPANRRYSADFPGVVCARVAQATGAPCLFVQGACGDINPLMEYSADDPDGAPVDGPDVMRRSGERLAQAVLRARLENVAFGERPPLRFARREASVGFRHDYRDRRHYDAFVQDNPYFQTTLDAALARAEGGDGAPRFPVSLAVLVLGGAVAFVGSSAEIFVQHQLDLKSRSPLSHALFCGYADGYAGYFPPVRDACAGGYGGRDGTFVELGAGDRLCVEALALTAELSDWDGSRPRA